MKVIVGLGNPGVEYINTRHNAGILLIDYLSTQCSEKSTQSGNYGWRKFYGILTCKFPDLILAKTADYFMNESGNVVRDVLRQTSPPTSLLSSGEGNFYLAHDDLDIKLGEYKIQKGVGPKLHNGVESVENALTTKDFWRIRIGVDNRDQGLGFRVQGEEYVLQKFTSEEKVILDGVLEKISTTLDLLVTPS